MKLGRSARIALFALIVAPLGIAALSASTTLANPVASNATDPGAKCAALVGRKISSGEITSARAVATGGSLVNEGALSVIKAGSDFCRVNAVLRPVAGSTIQVELWLPDDWNNKLLAVGGSGFSGGLDTLPINLALPVGNGYAGLATDAGHKTSDGARWAEGQPEKVTDWAHRANHVAAEFAKSVIEQYYGNKPSRSYFQGCSNGGRDALMEARRYPTDYDGIIAGAPAPDWTGLMTSFLWNWKAIFNSPGAEKLPTKIKAVSSAIRDKCDALDGVKDGILENPRMCRFKPEELQCRSGDSASCLTPPEVAALNKIYGGPKLKNGKAIYPGVTLGDEDIPFNANTWLDPSTAGTAAFGTEFFRWMVYKDANWKPESFDIDRDYTAALDRTGAAMNSSDPDIRAFLKRGGKLIVWHGWSDGRVQPERTVAYYEGVRKKVGASAANRGVRLFMAPGMAHCFGGPGPNKFEMLPELDRWVQKGTAPERVVATKYENDLLALINMPSKAVRTRPICAWPKTARYSGKGSTDDAANFVCR